jgi:serine protease
MKSRVSLLSAAIGVSILAMSAMSVSAADFRITRNPIQGQYIVVLKDDAARISSEARPNALVSSVARQMAASHRIRVRQTFDHAIRGFVVNVDDEALARLLADSRVAYVEEDGVMSIDAIQNGATWGLDRIDQRNLPLSGTFTYVRSASNVHAYIIDTGVRGSHDQFTLGGGARRMLNGFTSINDGGGTNDCNGHGTHVAGTVGGLHYGVAKGVNIHPVRVLGCDGSGSYSGIIAGMDWVVQNRVRPAVANMSLGGGFSQSVNDAVQRMVNAGVTVVVAAGNDNSNACSYSPASAASAITVGSTTRTDARSSFSNYGNCLDIFAPGSSITSASNTSNTATAVLSGTSMAAPHVAGAAALYLSTNTSASPAAVASALNSNSTPNKVTSAGSGSPNRLVYTLNF